MVSNAENVSIWWRLMMYVFLLRLPTVSLHRFRIGCHRVTCNMMASSNRNIFRVTGHLCGEFTGHRWFPRTKASGAALWCSLWSALDKRLSKRWWGFETPSRPLWRHVMTSPYMNWWRRRVYMSPCTGNGPNTDHDRIASWARPQFGSRTPNPRNIYEHKGISHDKIGSISS